MSIYIDSNIGIIFGNKRQLSVINSDKPIAYKHKIYNVHCSICSNDVELHGNANYKMLLVNIKANNIPCGCAKNPRWSKDQYEILINRKLLKTQFSFSNWVDEFKNQTSKIEINCNLHGKWTTNISNILNNNYCLLCAINKRANLKKSKVSNQFMDRIKHIDAHKNKNYDYSKFIYIDIKSNSVIICQDHGEFLQTPDNHLQGKGCPSCAKTNYDPNKDGYNYVCKLVHPITLHSFTGYGKSNKPQQRLGQHKKAVKNEGYEIHDFVSFKADSGYKASKIENNIKKEFKSLDNITISGFKEENTSIENYEIIIKYYNKGYYE